MNFLLKEIKLTVLPVIVLCITGIAFEQHLSPKFKFLG